MALPILNPAATVTIALEGLGVYCFNEAFDNNRGRWEVAIPRFGDHELVMDIPNVGVITVGREVNRIDIRDRVGVRPARPKHEVDPFDRKDKTRSDPKDHRWLAEFSNEIPHGHVIPKRRSDFPNRVRVTMLYIYDAVLYTKKVEDHPLLLATHAATCPVENGVPRPLPPEQAGRELDAIRDPYGFSATAVGIDIQSPNGGVVDIIFPDKVMSFNQAAQPHRISIKNLEPDDQPSADTIVNTAIARYARGDFFRYYELFVLGSRDRFHLWEKFPPAPPAPPFPALEGDCNGTGVNLPNLDDLAES